MQVTTRRLTDLWVVGRELTLDDGQGDPITVWLQKMNPAEGADTNRRCDAVRARTLATKDDPDTDSWKALHQSVLDFMDSDRKRVIEYLLVEERAKSARAQEAQIANNDYWSKDSRIQGLLDAWNDGLRARLEESPDDVEATTVKDQIDAYYNEVSEAVDADLDAIRDTLNSKPEEELIESMTDQLLQVEGNQAWMAELACCQIYFGTRLTTDHKQRYFLTRGEVDELAPETFARLRVAYAELEVDVAEGKDLPAPTSSSPSSEEPAAVVEETSSGLVGATR